jgi:hypothetical protein
MLVLDIYTYLYICFNYKWTFVLFILQLTGIVFLALGLYIKLQKHTYISLLGSSTFPLSTYLLLGTGAFIILTGIIGCTGTCIENKCFMVMVSNLLCYWTWYCGFKCRCVCYTSSDWMTSNICWHQLQDWCQQTVCACENNISG